MPKIKYESSSSESDSDDECLMEIARKRYLSKKYCINHNNKLFVKSTEICEFCEKKFNNKLEAFVHNAQHIIIPLIRVKDEISTDNHMDNVIQDVKLSPKTCASDEPTLSNKLSDILGGISKTSNIRTRIRFEDDEDDDVIEISDTDSLLNDLTTDCKVNLEAMTLGEETNHDSILNNFVTDCRVILDDPLAVFGIKEDDINAFDENILLNSLTSECQVDLGVPMLLEEEAKEQSDSMPNEVAQSNLLSYGNSFQSTPNIQEFYSNSVTPHNVYELSENAAVVESISSVIHNDDLLRPGLFKCDLCFAMFPNRFDMFQHKSKHLRVRRARIGHCIVCEKIRQHRGSNMCKYCLYTHGHVYKDTELDEHVTKIDDEFGLSFIMDLRVCEVCYLFLKRICNITNHRDKTYTYTKTVKTVYKRIGKVKKQGVKHVCEKCNYSTKKLYIVKKIQTTINTDKPKIRLVNHIEYEEDVKMKRASNSKTNENRLKRIRNRLKMNKFLSKF